MNIIEVKEKYNDKRYLVCPSFCDVHVHFREPGFEYKETIKTGSKCAARGGYTDVLTMPNLKPVSDSVENINMQIEAIKKDACVNVYPYAAITIGQKGEEFVNMEEVAPYAIAFSDDGRGVQNKEMMRAAMKRAKSLEKIIVAHCEDNSLLKGGYIHDGEYAKEHGHKGICSESEWGPIKRDIELAKETGCSYHVCHISCKESVELIRQAKKDGVDITCETAPHYLTMTDLDLKEDGRFKMNPPLRSKEDKEALILGIKDGTIDMIATDHAPHSEEEKSKGLKDSAFGIVGLESAFPILYTQLVKTGILTLEEVINCLTINPRKRFNIKNENDFCVWDLEKTYEINPNDFLSKGRATPFKGQKVYGECLMTVCNDNIVYKK